MRLTTIALIVLALVVLRWAVQMGLSWLNRRHVLAHADRVPEAYEGQINPATFAQSVQYTLAKGRLHRVEIAWDALLLSVLLFSGVLPWAYQHFTAHAGESIWAGAAFLFLVGICLAALGLPLDWYAQFRLEERFGFNTTTPKIWWSDRLKGLLLATALGYPFLALVLKIVQWTGDAWWFWAWAATVSFQILTAILAPVLILPLFNRFAPLPDGALRDRLQELARRTGFHARNIQVMDGSKRSRHSNAFFTGFGRFRKIVFFDTLLQQLGETELEAVLAHEIGHFKQRHIHKMLFWTATISLGAFYLLAQLARTEWFYRAFGFAPGNIVAALLLFSLLAGVVTFWLGPLANYWSRRFEYQADAFAARAMREVDSLVSALRKLNEKNLSNLSPHPAYSGFYYSHPTLPERERALRSVR